MKPGPILAMLVVVLLGLWLVYQPHLARTRARTEGTVLLRLTVGAFKADVEVRRSPAGYNEYRFLNWPGGGPARLGGPTDDVWLTQSQYDQIVHHQAQRWEAMSSVQRSLLGLFNVTSWANVAWIAVGLAGQACFFGRMAVQWIVSEQRRRSVVPAVFWWLSLGGGVLLFAYFVWRVDVVGVLGQSAGIVIYARNLRLIAKDRRRSARQPAVPASQDDPAPEPSLK